MRILPRQRAPHRFGLLAVVVCALLLTGCAQPDPVVTPHATSSAKPLFASDADALAAATKAYAAYLKMSDLISQEGGANPERLAPLVTPEWLKQQKVVFGDLKKTGKYQSGATTFTAQSLQQVDSDPSGKVTVVIYVCVDLSAIKMLDSTGLDVTPAGVQGVVPFEETFTGDAAKGSVLLLNEDAVWTGKNFC